jgi:excisionase family DNA binding protein
MLIAALATPICFMLLGSAVLPLAAVALRPLTLDQDRRRNTDLGGQKGRTQDGDDHSDCDVCGWVFSGSSGYLSTAEVAAGLRVTEQTVRTWCRLGVVPAIRPLGTHKWQVPRDGFSNWLHHAGGDVAASITAVDRVQLNEEKLETL